MPYELLKDGKPDEEKLKQYVELRNDLEKSKKEVAHLDKLVDLNREFLRYVWKMKDGTVIAIKDMTDSHLENSLRMLYRTEGVAINEELLEELDRRELSYKLEDIGTSEYRSGRYGQEY